MPSDNDKAIWQAQHAEACRYHRHWDTLKWTVIGLAYPSAAALVAFAIAHWDWATNPARVTVAVWVAAVWLFLAGAVYRQLHFYTITYVKRARELENKDALGQYGWTLHTRFPSDRLTLWNTLASWAWREHPRKLSVIFGWGVPYVGVLAAIALTIFCIAGWRVPC